MESWATYFITFLIGAATGAVGNYFASKYTDRRRNKDDANKRVKSFNNAKNQMLDLIKEMKEDFSSHKNDAIRELVILPNKRVIFNGDQPRFSYFEDEHQNLKGKISVLENLGFVVDVTVSNAPIFRIKEELWDLVLKS
jgi:hypothetical protein